VSDPDSTAAEAAYQAAGALLGDAFKEQYEILRGIVRKQFPALKDQDADLVHNMIEKALLELRKIDPHDQVTLDQFVVAWARPDPGYAVAARARLALKSVCRDRLKSAAYRHDVVTNPNPDPGSSTPLSAQPEPGATYPEIHPEVPDDVSAYLDAARRKRALYAVSQVLLERGRHTSPRAPYVTEDQRRYVEAWYEVNLTFGQFDSPSDHPRPLPLGRQGRPSGTLVGARFGVSKQKISQESKKFAVAVRLTRYLAGVLAPNRTLLDAHAIHTHLGEYDQLEDHPETRGYHQVLKSASEAVRKTSKDGTRAQPEHLARTNGQTIEQLVDAVHAAETYLAFQTSTPYPSCIIACPDHTRSRDRTTELDGEDTE